MNSLIYKFLILFLLSTPAFGFNQAIVQYAGEIGKYSFGIGDDYNKTYHYSFHYGYVPSNSLQNKIETYTMKNNFNLFRYNYKNWDYRFYTGIAAFHVPGNKYKTHEISDAPDNYYRQSSIRGLFYFGHNIRFKDEHSIFLESGINDYWIVNAYNNNSVDFTDHVSLGIGYNLKF
tara:strand:- start:136113 stop:136637 length:525 start_codon:yes stop_codon:yes gene_type:complete